MQSVSIFCIYILYLCFVLNAVFGAQYCGSSCGHTNCLRLQNQNAIQSRRSCYMKALSLFPKGSCSTDVSRETLQNSTFSVKNAPDGCTSKYLQAVIPFSNSSAFRLRCRKNMHTGCVSRNLVPASLKIPLQMNAAGSSLRSALTVCHWHTAVSRDS